MILIYNMLFARESLAEDMYIFYNYILSDGLC